MWPMAGIAWKRQSVRACGNRQRRSLRGQPGGLEPPALQQSVGQMSWQPHASLQLDTGLGQATNVMGVTMAVGYLRHCGHVALHHEELRSGAGRGTQHRQRLVQPARLAGIPRNSASPHGAPSLYNAKLEAPNTKTNVAANRHLQSIMRPGWKSDATGSNR
jgi:hypothetical protein